MLCLGFVRNCNQVKLLPVPTESEGIAPVGTVVMASVAIPTVAVVVAEVTASVEAEVARELAEVIATVVTVVKTI